MVYLKLLIYSEWFVSHLKGHQENVELLLKSIKYHCQALINQLGFGK